MFEYSLSWNRIAPVGFGSDWSSLLSNALNVTNSTDDNISKWDILHFILDIICYAENLCTSYFDKQLFLIYKVKQILNTTGWCHMLSQRMHIKVNSNDKELLENVINQIKKEFQNVSPSLSRTVSSSWICKHVLVHVKIFTLSIFLW